MLSNAQTDNSSSDRPSDQSSVIPTDIDGEPIRFSGNPAHVAGCLHELGLFFQRTGYFMALITDDAVLLSNGRLLWRRYGGGI